MTPTQMATAGMDAIRTTLQAARAGDFSQKIEVALPAEHPVALLADGINDMVSALATAREQSRARLADIEREAERIEDQRAVIRALSTPVIGLWRGVLCVPVVGLVDTDRASDVTQLLLEEVVRRRARAVIIDVTGVQVMDTTTTSHFLRLAASVGLLGSSCAITGFSPAVVASVVHMGIDFSSVRTFRSIRDALQHYLAEGDGRRRPQAGQRRAGQENSNGRD
jgi:rsbT co-antagonist protein RsbR